jgi:peptidoglycan hydrolase-like protein with peptidoglycan-binding domain
MPAPGASSGGGGGAGGAPRYPGHIMRRGMSGPNIRTFQAQLNRRGWQPVLGAADGIFGPRTESAVQGFQRNQRIACDGIVGPVTWPRFWGGTGGGPIRGGCR